MTFCVLGWGGWGRGCQRVRCRLWCTLHQLEVSSLTFTPLCVCVCVCVQSFVVFFVCWFGLLKSSVFSLESGVWTSRHDSGPLWCLDWAWSDTSMFSIVWPSQRHETKWNGTHLKEQSVVLVKESAEKHLHDWTNTHTLYTVWLFIRGGPRHLSVLLSSESSPFIHWWAQFVLLPH